MHGRGHGLSFHSKDSAMSSLVALEGLILSLDPGKQILGGDAQPSLGENVVPNGDFHDFTMDQFEGGDPIDETADSMTLTEGTVDGGSLSDTYAVDGNTLDIRETQSAVPGMDVDFDFGLSLNYVGLYFHITGSHNSSHDLTIQAWNGTGWDDIGIWEARTSVNDAAFGLEPEHTASLNVNIRILHPAMGITSHVVSIDEMYVNSHYPEYTKAHWIFDDTYHDGETTGLEVNEDLSANGNHLTPSGFSSDFGDELVSGSPVYKDGNGLEFDGVDDVLSITSTDLNPGTEDFSLAINFKTPETLPFSNSIIHHGQGYGDPGGFGILISMANDVLSFSITDVSGSVWFQGSQSSLDADTEYHLLISVDRDGSQLAYLNGQSFADQTATNSDNLATTSPFAIGANRVYTPSFSYFFEGTIYEAMFHVGKALNQDEVNTAYAAPKDFEFKNSALVVGDLPEKIDFTVKCARKGRDFIIPVKSSDLESGELYKIVLQSNDSNLTVNYRVKQSGTQAIADRDSDLTWYINQASVYADKVYLQPTSSVAYVTLSGVTCQKVLNADNIDNGRSEHYLEDYSQGGQSWIDSGMANTGLESNIIDTDGDGIGDGWSVTTNKPGNTASIVTGNGFAYNAQRFAADDGSGTYIRINSPYLVTSGGGFYRLSYKYRSGATIYVYTFSYEQARQPANTGDAVEVSEVYYVDSNVTLIRFQSNVGTAAGWMEISEVKLEYLGNGIEGVIQNGLEGNNLQHHHALDLDGVDDYVDFGDNLDVLDHDFIIQSWVYGDDYSIAQSCILSKRGSTGFNFGIDIGGNLQFIFDDGSGNHDFSGSNLSESRWHNVAIAYNRDGNATLYIDGQLDATLASWANGSIDIATSLLMGQSNSLQYFNGKIGMLQYYIFDGLNDRPSALPSGYATDIIQYNYNAQKPYYEDL